MKIQHEQEEGGIPFSRLEAGHVYAELNKEGDKNGCYVLATDEGSAVHVDSGTLVTEVDGASFRYLEVSARMVIGA
jgi:hypothetical protein